jgi:hypothetical protein
MAGAPKGNNNAAKTKIWSDALRKAIVQGKSLDNIANALILKALEGDIAAIKEIGDRLEGKVAQTQIVQGDEEGGAVQTRVTICFE